MTKRSINTRVVHSEQDSRHHFGSVSEPIYTSSVFAFDDVDDGIAIHNYEKPGYFYGRLGNPTQDALDRKMAELETGEDAISFASGMAAISAAVLTFVKTGDHIIAPSSMYSTTTNLLRYLSDRFGVAVSFVDSNDAENYRRALRPNTRILWIETPSNPLVQITDISAVVEIAREAGAATIADNTFATPFNQRPLELGVDVVIHSATKYLGGHSDLTAGVLVGSSEYVDRARHEASKFFGGNIAPQVAWLVMRGIKTLALRMERHNANASAMADMLASHAKTVAVYYPALESQTNHDIAVRQMSGFGGMIGLDLGTADAAKAFVGNVKICTFATSLGGVETIVQPSALMTHAALSAAERETAGISDGLIRMSVGIEDIADLIEDVSQALDRIA